MACATSAAVKTSRQEVFEEIPAHFRQRSAERAIRAPEAASAE
jgi:hypothetical protein